jgi:hypothetical protein
MPTKKQHAKSRKSNAFKTKRTRKGVSKSRKSMLFQMDTGTGPERKSVDTVSSFATALTSSFATPQLLNGVAQGSNSNERIGRKTTTKSVLLNYTFTPNAPASQTRILVVYDKQANGAAPIAGDILFSNSFLSPTNLGNADRFVILMDEISDSAQSSAIDISGKRYLKCNLETCWSGTGGAIANILSGSIYIMAANNADPTIGVVASCYFHARIRYTDV